MFKNVFWRVSTTSFHFIQPKRLYMRNQSGRWAFPKWHFVTREPRRQGSRRGRDGHMASLWLSNLPEWAVLRYSGTYFFNVFYEHKGWEEKIGQPTTNQISVWNIASRVQYHGIMFCLLQDLPTARNPKRMPTCRHCLLANNANILATVISLPREGQAESTCQVNINQ